MSSKKLSTQGSIGLGFSLRLSLYYGAFAALLALGVFFLAYVYITSSVKQSEYRWLEEQVAKYRQWYEAGGLAALQTRFQDESSETGELGFLRVFGVGEEAGFVSLPSSGVLVDFNKLRAVAPGEEKRYQIRFGEEESTWTVIEEPFSGDLTIQLGRSLRGGATVLGRFRDSFAIAIIPALLLGIVGGTWLTFQAMGPIRRLIATIREILATGDLEKRAESRKGLNELNALVDLFNEMLGRNQRSVSSMRESLDSVAHDLRTPMMRLRVTAEEALSEIQDPRAREALGEILEESESIRNMLDMLMDLGEAESGALQLELEDVKITEVFGPVIDLYEFVAEEKHISLRCLASDEISLEADPMRLRQAVANLVDNALKYSPIDSEVTLSAEATEREVIIRVRDEGEGISDSERERIWERLYRIDASRSKPGLGLGLSLVRAIAEAHHGLAQVESKIGQGSTFIMRLPKSPSG